MTLYDKDSIRRWVLHVFTPQGLGGLIPACPSRTEQLAWDYLLAAGKRTRPLLTAWAWAAMCCPNERETLRPLIVAVECFHKASLIHDDMEDGDCLRDGRATLHRQVGPAVALNAGDLLIAEGYRLLGECKVDVNRRLALLVAAARAQRKMCVGQGAELAARGEKPLTVEAMIEVFCLKTSSAFELALVLAAICAGADDEILASLREFSRHLGVAYQVMDDLRDVDESGGSSIVVALAARESCSIEAARELADSIWRRHLLQAKASADVSNERLARILSWSLDLVLQTPVSARVPLGALPVASGERGPRPKRQRREGSNFLLL